MKVALEKTAEPGYILNLVYLVRGKKVLLDRDLAKLYGINTKVLKQSVKRNLARFPGGFMFETDEKEFKNWRSQFVTSKADSVGLRYAPFCSTELGIAMLSSVLKNEKAIQVNVFIMRAFQKMKQQWMDLAEIKADLERFKTRTNNNTKSIELLLSYFDGIEAKRSRK